MLKRLKSAIVVLRRPRKSQMLQVTMREIWFGNEIMFNWAAYRVVCLTGTIKVKHAWNGVDLESEYADGRANFHSFLIV